MIVLSRELKYGWSRSCLGFITVFSLLLVSSTVFGGTIFSNPDGGSTHKVGTLSAHLPNKPILTFRK